MTGDGLREREGGGGSLFRVPRITPRVHNMAMGTSCGGSLVGACLATGDRIFATGSDSVSKTALRSCGFLCLISVHTIMV